jgi:hypothetical protein
MTKEELAVQMYDADPLWDHGLDRDGAYKRWPIKWSDLNDHGHEGDVKRRALKHAEVALRVLA